MKRVEPPVATRSRIRIATPGTTAIALLLPAMLAGCNDTRDLAPPDPAAPWRPALGVHDAAGAAAAPSTPAARPATGTAAAGARDAGWQNPKLAALPPLSYPLPADPALPYADPHPVIDPHHVYALAELIDIAERNNKQTRIAWEQARQAAINVGISQAAYLPALTSSALGGIRHETTPSPVPQGFVTSDTEGVFPTLTLTYLLFDFGNRRATREAARANSEAANVEFTQVHQQLILTVTQAFLSYASAGAQLEAANSALRNADLIAAAAQSRLSNGEGTTPDLANARSSEAQAKFAIASAQANLQDTRDTLLEALALPPRTPIQVQSLDDCPVPTGVRADLDTLMHQALQSRPDLLASLARLRASEAQTVAARSALYPSVSLSTNITGDLGRIEVEGGPSHSFEQPETGLYISLKWPIYEGGMLANQVRLAESREAQSRDALQQSEDEALRDVATAYDQLESGLTQYDAAIAAQKAAHTAFTADASAFQHGEGTDTAAQNAATTLDQSDATLARAHAQVLASAATLAFATGQLTSAENLPR